MHQTGKRPATLLGKADRKPVSSRNAGIDILHNGDQLFPVVGLQVHHLCTDQFYCRLFPAGIVLDVVERQQHGKGPVCIFMDRIEYFVPPRVIRVFTRRTGRTEHVKPPTRSWADSMDRTGTVSEERARGTCRMKRKLLFQDFPQGPVSFFGNEPVEPNQFMGVHRDVLLILTAADITPVAARQFHLLSFLRLSHCNGNASVHNCIGIQKHWKPRQAFFVIRKMHARG